MSGIAATDDIYLIGLDEEHIDKLVAGSLHYSRATISKKTYNTSADIDTVAVGAVLIASDEASDDDIYNIVSGIYDNTDAITGEYSKGAELELQEASAVSAVPYHPGAAKYYEENGITVSVK